MKSKLLAKEYNHIYWVVYEAGGSLLLLSIGNSVSYGLPENM